MAKRSIWFGAGFSLMLVLGVALANRIDDDGLALPAEKSMAAAVLQDTIGGSRRNAIVVASQRVAPAVVSVNVVRQSRQPRTMWESMFFPETDRRDAGLGSGFIIREDGLVLTNEHVVRGASEVVVTLADGRDFAATIVGRDEVTDLALLRLRDAKGLPVAPMGASNNLIIGEWAVAIGNPYGFYLSNAEPTVTAGVISGVGRNIIPNGNENEGVYLDMIQTDASINPGNSGGPLVNALGQVIGVNSSILSASGGSIGLGFAIPIDRARRIAADLLANGQVRRAWIGADVKASAPNAFGRSRHVEIDQIAPGSPAANAGLKGGQLVVAVNKRPVYNPLDFQARMIDARVGEALEIVVSDAGRERTLRVNPQPLPSLSAERVRALSDHFELISVTPAIRSERHIVSQRGALITKLSQQALAIGLRNGDVILEINRAPVRTAEEAAQIMSELFNRVQLRLTIERQGSYMIVFI